MNKISYTLSAIGLVVTLLTACQPLEPLSGDPNTPQGNLNCAWAWPDSKTQLAQLDFTNDMVTVLAVRPTALCHYYGETKRVTNGQWATVTNSDFPDTGASRIQEVVTGNAKYNAGTYELFSFNSNGGKYFTVDYSDFRASNFEFFKDLRMTFDTYRHGTTYSNPALYQFEDIMAMENNREWEFIAPFKNTIWWSSLKNVSISQGKTTKVKFSTYERVTQDFVVAININETEPGMYINNVRGVVTGTLTKTNIKSGVLQDDIVCATLFTAPTNDSYTKQESIAVKIGIPVLGIVHNTDTKDTSKDRTVLRLYMNVMHRNAGGVLGSKLLCAEYPLDELFRKTPSIKYNTQHECVRATDIVELKIPTTLTISPNTIVTPATPGATDWRDITE